MLLAVFCTCVDWKEVNVTAAGFTSTIFDHDILTLCQFDTRYNCEDISTPHELYRVSCYHQTGCIELYILECPLSVEHPLECYWHKTMNVHHSADAADVIRRLPSQ